MAQTCTDLFCSLELPEDAATLAEEVVVNTGVNNANCPTRYPMGLGDLGSGEIIFKRKFRWTFEIEFCCGGQGGSKKVAAAFVKVGSRPNIEFDEIEINYLNGKKWIPGKGTWQPITVTYYDVAGNTDSGASTDSILAWIATIYDITDPVCLSMNSTPKLYEGVARLVMYDGCGNPLEGWLLKHVWPQTVNWGDLDMSSSDEATIEMTLRYSEVCFKNYCPASDVEKCDCEPCPGLT